MSSPSVVKWGLRTLRTVRQSCHAPKIARRKRAKSSITERRIIQFRSNFVQSLSSWQSKCCKSSISRSQRSRSQRDITCAQIRKIISNSAADCSISLKFRTDFDHVTLDVPRTFKVNVLKVKVTAWHSVAASEKRYNSGKNKLSNVKLGENYISPSALHDVQGH